MNYEVNLIDNFKREFQNLASKYPSLLDEVDRLIETLSISPNQGVPLGGACYKIRLAIKSKGKGKRGGARIITYVKIIANTVYLLSIYNKGDKDDITDKELKLLVKQATQH